MKKIVTVNLATPALDLTYYLPSKAVNRPFPLRRYGMQNT